MMDYQDKPAHFKKYLENSADELINSILCNLGTSPDWQTIARLLALELITLKHKHDAIASVGNQFVSKYQVKRAQEKARVANRKDQQDKELFQQHVARGLLNIQTTTQQYKA
jgi:hypothetical protein